MDAKTRKYLAEIGRRGGLKSRRRLDPELARMMVRVREARRAYSLYHARCFWSCPPGLEIGADDIAWVAEQLMRYGGREAWEKGASLCR